MVNFRQKMPILDVFRFLAAMLVVLVHYEHIFGSHLILGGYATTAVSWFFIVSGFVLAYNYPEIRNRDALKRFYTQRVLRIYPVYFASVLASAALVFYVYTQVSAEYFANVMRPEDLRYDLPETKDGTFWGMAVLRHLTFTQSVGEIGTLKLLFNPPLWSLVLEMYFYLCFPLLLLLLASINTRLRVLFFIVFGFAIQILLLQLFLPEAESYGMKEIQVPVYTNPLIRVFEFMFGIVLCKACVLLPDDEKTRSSASKYGVLVALVILYALHIHFGSRYIPYQYHAFIVTVPVIVAMVYALVRVNWYPSERVGKFCGLLGGLSYIIYCFHWPLMELIRQSGWLPEELSVPVRVVLVISLVLCFSLVFYRYAETFLRSILKSATGVLGLAAKPQSA